jgi:GAF domain-containing protein
MGVLMRREAMAKDQNTDRHTKRFQRYKEAHRRLKLLLKVRTDIDATMDLDLVLPKSLDTSLKVVGVKTGSIMLLNQEGELEFKARRGNPAPLSREKFRSFKVGEGIAGWVALHGKPALVPDVTQDKRFVHPKPGGVLLFRSLLSVPIMPADTAIGVINADHPEPNRFTDTDLRLLSDLAAQALIAIGRAGLVHASQALQQAAIRHQTLPAFLEDVANITRRLLYAPVCVIRLFDEYIKQLKVVTTVGLDPRHVAVLESLTLNGHSFQSGRDDRPVYIDHLAALEGTQAELITKLGLASGLVTVMKMKEQIFGTIEVYTLVPRQFAPWEHDLFRVFADQTAVFIENIGLLEQEKNRVHALASLHEVGQSLTRLTIEPQEGQLENILQEIANQALNVSGADIVTLYQYFKDTSKFVTPPTIGGKENLLQEEPMTTKVYEDDVVARIARLGRPHWAPNAQTDAWMYGTGIRDPKTPEEETRPRFVLREKVKSSVGIPLKVGDEVVGVMFFNYRTPQRFSEDDRILLETFANSAAIAIQNARQYNELRTAQAQLVKVREQTWKEFSATTAHRMGTEAADIVGALRWLKEALGSAAENEEAKQYLTRIEKALRRTSNYIHQFTEFAKPPELKLERTDVNDLLCDARSNVSLEGLERVKIHMELADDLPDLWGDRDRLFYSFKEMFQNAIKAMSGGGDLRVVTQRINQGTDVRIEFIDKGSGIVFGLKERIFELGFRNRPGGMGLGLAIVRRTMQEHGGSITEVGVFGQGAHFVMELPAGMPRR